MCWNKNSMKYLLAMGMVFLSFMTRPILSHDHRSCGQNSHLIIGLAQHQLWQDKYLMPSPASIMDKME